MNKLHLRIGSSPNNQLILEDLGIDAHHLELFSDEYGNVFITDLESKNGTFINNIPLKGFKLLQAGDKLRLGQNYNFDWENLNQNNKHVFSEQKETKNTHVDLPLKSKKATIDKTSFSLNKQLIVIYGCILILLFSLISIL